VREFLRAGKVLEARRIRRRRLAVACTIAVLVVVAVVLALMNREARQQRNQAEEQRAEAEEKRAVALREGARAALLRDDVNEARAKLRMALEIQHADSLLGRALWREIRGRPLQRTVTLPMLQANEVAFSPDGQQLAVGETEAKVFVIEPRTGRVLHVHRAAGEVCMSGLAFSPDGKRLAIGTYTGTVEIWHPSSGKVLRLKGHGVAFHPDGQLLAVLEREGRVTLWNATSRKRVRTLSFPGKIGFLRPAGRAGCSRPPTAPGCED
jgi:dipeptidyl aminopeptidase/acylaminoacyl peptidase